MSETNDRAAMLEKLNDAFERATQPETPPLPDEPDEPAFEHVSHDIGGLYGEDGEDYSREADKPRDSESDYDEEDDWDDENVPVKKKGKAGKIIGIVLGALLLLALAGATIIAEPWVSAPVDSYVEPTAYTAAPDKTIGVGETYAFEDLPLGGNAAVSRVEVSDADILDTDGVSSVTGKGEYFNTTAKITVSEKSIIPLSTTKDFALFGMDLSGPYNKIRTALRDLIGVEKTAAERTELRVLELYEMNIAVDDLSRVTTTTEVSASTSTSADIKLELGANEDFRFVSGDAAQTVSEEQETSSRTAYTYKSGDDTVLVVKAVRDEDGNEYYINGRKSGALATVVAEVGFWKKVDVDTYARYLEATGQTAPAAEEDDADEDEAAAHVNEIFVPTRAVSYIVKVA